MGANQNVRKLLFTDLGNTKKDYLTGPTRTKPGKAGAQTVQC